MSWYSLTLTNSADTYERRMQIQTTFGFHLGASEAPVAMAMFSALSPDRTMVTLYFSPAAASFAQGVGAFPCQRPALEEVKAPIVGQSDCIRTLWPEQAQADESCR